MVPNVFALDAGGPMGERFATCRDAVDWLTTSTDYERMRRVRYNADTFDLDRVTALMEAVGRADRRFRSVHIAGTKGKGSTAAMIEAILRRHGLRTGLFTSPHLVDLRERIQIDRAWIDEDLLRRTTGLVAGAAETVKEQLSGQPPTFFELITAVAFSAFADAGVDVAVVEVGLGGRLDSTNVITPEAAVITSISIDHVHQLGDDLVKIAGEKAGIIKAGVPLVLAPQQRAAERVVLDAASRAGAPVTHVGRDVRVERRAALRDGLPVSTAVIVTPRATYEEIELPLGGRFQATNAACAIAAGEIVLREKTDAEAVRAGLAGVRWPGRMQTFPGDVTVILDGAHNADSLRELLDAVGEYYPDKPVVAVFASAADKDVPGMAGVLARYPVEVVVTRTDNPRAADPEELAQAIRQAGGSVAGASPSPETAMHLARERLGPQGIIVLCGSLYLVGTVLEHPERFGLPPAASV